MSHLTEDELVAWRDNAADEDGAVEAHLSECPTCSAAYDSLLQSPRITELEFSDDLALVTADAPLYFKPADRIAPTYAFQKDPRTAVRPFGLYAWRAWASIAGVVALVWALMALVPTPKPAAAMYSEPNGTIELVGSSAPDDPTAKIQWRSDAAGATQYQAVLRDDAGLVVFGLITSATNASLPAEIVERLQPERTYTWSVTALSHDANPIASTSRSFSLPATAR